MTLKGDAILKENLTGGLKNDIRNLINFYTSSRKSENLHFDGLALSQVNKFRWKSAEELCLATLKSDSQKKLILEKYVFFVWCNRLEAVSGRCT